MKQYARHQAGRMFENGFLEAASKVHPATPFLFYIPIITFVLGWALLTGHTTWVHAAVFVPAGWVIWQLMEYGLHRSLFHWEGNGPFTRRFHAIIHGYHHTYPDDGMRLVMPLGASVPLALVIAGLLWLVGHAAMTIPMFVGIVAGYLWYDFLHFATHHFKPRTSWGKAVRAHHMAHHFNTPDKNFGISHVWVDKLMGTMRQRPTQERSAE